MTDRADNADKSWALVTGASAGIGLAFARVIAADGLNLVLVARRRDRLEQLAGELNIAHGTQCNSIAVDLADAGAPQAIFDELRTEGIAIDLFVNNAGLLVQDNVQSPRRWADQLDVVRVNVLAHTWRWRICSSCRCCSGNRGRHPQPGVDRGQPAGAESRGLCGDESLRAVVQRSVIRTRSGGSKVTVTALCPGITDTGMVHGTGLEGDFRDSWCRRRARRWCARGYRACLCGKTRPRGRRHEQDHGLRCAILPRSDAAADGRVHRLQRAARAS